MGSYSLYGNLDIFRNFLYTFFILAGVILYFIPVSRSYFCKGCNYIIDAMAYSLKTAVDSLDNRSLKKKHSSHYHSKIQESSKHSNDEKSNRRKDYRPRDYSVIFKETRKRNGEWPESHNSSDQGLEPQRESYFDFQWSKEMTDKQNDDILHLNNDTVNESYDYNQMSNVDKIKNSIDLKESSKKKRDDKKKRQSKRITYSDYQENDKNDEYKEKLRKLHKRIRSLLSISDKDLKQQKELEALKLIEDILKNEKIKNEKYGSEKLSKLDVKNKTQLNKSKVKETDTDDEADASKLNQVDNAGNSWTGRKSAVSSRKESQISNNRKSRKLSIIENEDFTDDSDDFIAPPIIHDRVTPILKNIYGWIFGGCPSSK